MLRFLPATRETRTESRPEATSLPSPRLYRVRIDMEQLRSHVSPLSRAAVNDTQLRKWLVQSGFRPAGDWWVVPESGLAQLAPSELTASEVLN
jgi:hypothetical protein